jgi:hypothetical protein
VCTRHTVPASDDSGLATTLLTHKQALHLLGQQSRRLTQPAAERRKCDVVCISTCQERHDATALHGVIRHCCGTLQDAEHPAKQCGYVQAPAQSTVHHHHHHQSTVPMPALFAWWFGNSSELLQLLLLQHKITARTLHHQHSWQTPASTLTSWRM